MMQDRWRLLLGRVRRLEQREVRDLRRWFERTNTLIHLSVLVLVPALTAVVTSLSNAVGTLSFLVYPPLASGAYTLFADPGGRYASPLRFVAGLTVGAVCGLAGVEAAALLYTTPPGQIHAAGAALTIFLTGLVTWLLGVEEPSAFAMSLVTLFVQARVDRPGYFVLSAAVGSAIVALAFVGWRHWIYEQRAHYLYETTSSDDHVLVPMRGPHAGATAMLAAQLAAAHRAGKVVLLDIVEEEWLARAERSLLESHGGTDLVRTGPSLEGEPVGDDTLDPDDAGAHEAVSEAVYDLVIIGASQDRSVASRFVSPPTFERIDSDEIGTDVAIVDWH